MMKVGDVGVFLHLILLPGICFVSDFAASDFYNEQKKGLKVFLHFVPSGQEE